ncbi:hypothetical protein, conserved [Leishmania tarentolae]|uniref:EF-hand domain-containing protein n=1 Tax=Leishmania tarentolae TaxID=5689 RepID=A0A640K8L0_LEITA|nr:hypothetical protein, conserved [Leishmania tarentolae]
MRLTAATALPCLSNLRSRTYKPLLLLFIVCVEYCTRFDPAALCTDPLRSASHPSPRSSLPPSALDVAEGARGAAPPLLGLMRRQLSAGVQRRVYAAPKAVTAVQRRSTEVRAHSSSNSSCGLASSSSLSLPCSFKGPICDGAVDAPILPALMAPSSYSGGRQHFVWALLAGWCVGVALCVSAGVSVALCRSYDTPTYLIPYYLRDVRSRFLHYASVRKHKGGPMYMTAEDFVLALLASPEKALPNPNIVQDLQRLFESMDANGDGYISFPEFRFLMSLLTSDLREVEALFRIVGTDESGTLSLEEFANVLRGATKDEAVVRSFLKPSTRRNGVVRALFGDDAAPRRCSFSELEAVIHRMRVEIWKAEFHQYDVEKHNRITAEAFAALIARQVLGSHLPYYLVDNIRRLHGSGDVVTLDMWLGLNEVMLYAEQLAVNVELFMGSGLSVTQRDFCRLLSMAGVPALPPATTDIIMAVFDKNGDGSVEMDEFLSIMRKKVKYHYSAPPRERTSLPRRFLKCFSDVLADVGR